MPRNSAGTMSLPSGQPVVSGTTISSTAHNALASDLASEITNSLDRGGRGAMTGQLPLANGTVAAPGLTFGTDPDTGLYHIGVNNIGIAANGAKVVDVATTGVAVTGVLSGTTLSGSSGATVGTLVGGEVLSLKPGTSTDHTYMGFYPDSAAAGTRSATVGFGSAGGTEFSIACENNTGPHFYATGTASAGTFHAGTTSLAATPQVAATLANGNLSLSGVANATSTVGHTNTLCPMNLPKAWARLLVTCGDGGAFTVAVTSGFNIASVARASATTFTVTIADDMADANFMCVASAYGVGFDVPLALANTSIAAGAVTIKPLNTIDGSAYDMDASDTVLAVNILIFGAQ